MPQKGRQGTTGAGSVEGVAENTAVDEQGDEVRGSDTSNSDTSNGDGRQDAKGRPESLLPMFVTWVSGLLLLLAAIYLIWDGLSDQQEPSFSTTIEEVHERAGSHYVTLQVTNNGGQSVQALGVNMDLREGERVVESAQVTVDWLPEGSSRKVVLIFSADPDQHQVVTSLQGYQVP